MVQTTPTYDCVTFVTTRAATPKVHGENRARTLNRMNTRCAFSAAQGVATQWAWNPKKGETADNWPERLRSVKSRGQSALALRGLVPASHPLVHTHAHHLHPSPSSLPSRAVPVVQCALQRSHWWREWKSRPSQEYRWRGHSRLASLRRRAILHVLLCTFGSAKSFLFFFFSFGEKKKIGQSLLDFIGMHIGIYLV